MEGIRIPGGGIRIGISAKSLSWVILGSIVHINREVLR